MSGVVSRFKVRDRIIHTASHPQRGRRRDDRRGLPAARHFRSRTPGADAQGLVATFDELRTPLTGASAGMYVVAFADGYIEFEQEQRRSCSGSSSRRTPRLEKLDRRDVGPEPIAGRPNQAGTGTDGTCRDFGRPSAA